MSEQIAIISLFNDKFTFCNADRDLFNYIEMKFLYICFVTLVLNTSEAIQSTCLNNFSIDGVFNFKS